MKCFPNHQSLCEVLFMEEKYSQYLGEHPCQCVLHLTTNLDVLFKDKMITFLVVRLQLIYLQY